MGPKRKESGKPSQTIGFTLFQIYSFAMKEIVNVIITMYFKKKSEIFVELVETNTAFSVDSYICVFLYCEPLLLLCATFFHKKLVCSSITQLQKYTTAYCSQEQQKATDEKFRNFQYFCSDTFSYKIKCRICSISFGLELGTNNY